MRDVSLCNSCEDVSDVIQLVPLVVCVTGQISPKTSHHSLPAPGFTIKRRSVAALITSAGRFPVVGMRTFAFAT